ncbi:hypothetical protein C900_03593 [Fulvivirga imtechensis AK7]|uniref:Uncharacterized protein n=1 Tax=Fulvivirga imtechensis AK7 TaxID=1237149 RepID=L8JTE3_9BACT|nr:hypothetical protein [Fulvivirga imtechensis]ELR70612.1 hypothetical protein C900_03593 [Fulvivirga imtechensis AK7]
MLYGIFIIVLGYFIAGAYIDKIIPARSPKSLESNVFLKRLYFYHFFLSAVYYTYALFESSDSKFYYRKVIEDYRGPGWFDFYGVSTRFIEFTGYPFIKYLGFSYEAIMALFSIFGFFGFIYFYLFFQEKVVFKERFFGYNLLTIFFLLPNLHFWSGSFGKGSFIFLGISMFFYGLNNVQKRWIIIIIGGLITYHIRPHIMFVILASTAIGFAFSTRGVGWGTRFAVIVISVGAFFFVYQDVLALVGVEEGEELQEGLDLAHRAKELSKATSGVDIRDYSLPEKVFTFLYRPLFFDAPGFLGIVVSFENVFLLLITLYFIVKGGVLYLLRGDFLIKTAFFSFITVSIALAQISGNLGIAIRQKSQVMMLFLFIILKFLSDKKMVQYKKWVSKKKRSQARAEIYHVTP